jgi:hypothetical protein
MSDGMYEGGRSRPRARVCFALAARAIAAAMAIMLLSARAAAQPVLHVPADHATIQDAVNAAPPGGTIIVADGVYSGLGNRNINFAGKAITLRSESGAEACTIDVSGALSSPYRAFHFNNGETAASVVEGFTIRNGVMSRGGAVLCEGGSSPTFRQCVFRSNTAWTAAESEGGGAVYIVGGSPTFIECEFVQNHVQVNGQHCGGGGVYCTQGSHPSFTECTFSGNVVAGLVLAGRGGGGVYMTENSNAQFSDCSFLSNNALGGQAGGLFMVNGCGAAMENCEFRDNLATSAGGLSVGLNCQVALESCRFEENFVTVNGGAFRLTASLECSFVDCTFLGNVAVNGRAGAGEIGLHSRAFPVTRFTNCLFAGNNAGPAQHGGALVINDHVSITNSTFTQNVASSGGAMYIAPLVEVSAANSIMWGDSPPEIAFSVPKFASFTATYCAIEGGWNGEGNLDADPLFAKAAARDFRLTAGSPCVDAGNNFLVPPGVQFDLAGQPRFVDGNDDRLVVVDMGALELQDAPAVVGDITQDGQVNVDDLVALLLAWGACPPPGRGECPADIAPQPAGDSVVNVDDLVLLLLNWS